MIKDIFKEELEQRAIRDGYGTGLLLAGEKNCNVVALAADVTESTRSHLFAKKFPKRFIQVGVAEQNMACLASGLAVSGKIPFIASFAIFSPGRNWEQIRTTIAYNNANVKIMGHHTGVSVGPDGATHQATEDIALMRTLPNMCVCVPCDAIEAEKAVLAATQIVGPVYLRFTREKTSVITTPATPFVPGKAAIFYQSKKKPEVAIIACGPLVYNAILAAKKLEEEYKIGSMVINNHSIKPMDEKTIISAAKKCGSVVTVEAHQVQGGMGSAVAEVLVKNHPVPVEFIGMQNTFGESGNSKDLLKKYEMTEEDIERAAIKVIKRKK